MANRIKHVYHMPKPEMNFKQELDAIDQILADQPKQPHDWRQALRRVVIDLFWVGLYLGGAVAIGWWAWF
jgi:hypothetical protein